MNLTEDRLSASDMRERYAAVLDGLLDAGSRGEPLQLKHLPHLGATKLLVALPGVLVESCHHVAEIDFETWRIRYKHVMLRSDFQPNEHPRYTVEATQYAISQWGGSFAPFKPSCIRQRRGPDNKCGWSVFGENGDLVMRTRRISEFMELAGRCDILYDE